LLADLNYASNVDEEGQMEDFHNTNIPSHLASSTLVIKTAPMNNEMKKKDILKRINNKIVKRKLSHKSDEEK
jgi:hypothetical protein